MKIDPEQLQRQMMEALQQAQQMQEELAKEVFEESSGGGAVTVKVNGALEVTEVAIAPEAIDPDDPEMLADLVLAATNAALRKAQSAVRERLGGMVGGLGGLGLPGL